MCVRLRALPRETLYERPLSARRPRGAEEAGRPAVEGPAGLGGGGGGRGKQGREAPTREPNGLYGSEFSEQRGGNDPSPDLGTDGVRRARTCGSAPHRRCPRNLALPCGSRALETRRCDLGTAF